MKVVLLNVQSVKNFESPHLDQYKSSYDLNNWNYSVQGNVMRQISRTELFPYIDDFSAFNRVHIWIHLFNR